MVSLPTIDNDMRFGEVVRTVDPYLYNIHVALTETGLNPVLLPPIIRSLAMLNIGSGYGKVQILMVKNKITSIVGEENVLVQENVMVEK